MRPIQRIVRPAVGLALALAVSLVFGASIAESFSGGSLPLPTTANDFVQPGIQPGQLIEQVFPATACNGCHGGYDEAQEPYERWTASMMGQAGRDPVFYAALAIANQDVAEAGEYCLRCHAPGAWLDGRCTPADGSALNPAMGDLDGVTCHVCHRMVDTQYDEGVSPVEDTRVLRYVQQMTGLNPPQDFHSGQYVIDPVDRRRGPYDLGGPSFHLWLESPFHQQSAMCGTCHDISNPAISKNPDGTFSLNAVDTPHPDGTADNMFPVERTYSEWTVSEYAKQPVETGGRFGGNKTAVQSCQDCHMPDTTGQGCQPAFGPPVRDDLPQHNFAGVNSWVLRAVRNLYPDNETNLSEATVNASIARTIAFQQSAADLDVWEDGAGNVVVRVVNQTGHKLPSGYVEGRRMWLNLRFFDGTDMLIGELGAYDPVTAELDKASTRTYETEHGLNAEQAMATGLPEGKSFHFVLNNTIIDDTRIPPRGYHAADFEAIGAPFIGVSYQEEQFWADDSFAIPMGAVRVEVNLYHQTTTKEYIEFLRDENTTNGDGLVAYNQWVATGKSEPVLKATLDVPLGSGTGAACAEPVSYGMAKETSVGDIPELSWSGTPSLAVNDFVLHVSGARPNRPGSIFLASGTASTPAMGGTLLLNDYSTGRFFLPDMLGNASVSIPIVPGMVGTEVYYQAIFRDFGDPFLSGLTNALVVNFCP